MIARDLIKFKRKPNIINIPRKNRSAYIHLKTGIGYLKTYFYKIKNSNSFSCFRECKKKQSTEHLVLYCKTYKKEREKMRKALKGLPISLQILFCTVKGRKALAEFLADTNICTANWYINAGLSEI
jgi:hypothetical protein